MTALPFKAYDMAQRFVPCSGQGKGERNFSVRDASSYESRFWRPYDSRGRVKLFTWAGACAYADRLNRGELSP